MGRYKVYYLYSTEIGSDLVHMRYIGQTKQTLKTRLQKHIAVSLRSNTNIHVQNWIKSTYLRGFEVKIGLLVDNAIKNIDEIVQIAKYKELGCFLTNKTKGGEGGSGPKSEETKNKIRIKLTGVKHPKERCIKNSEANKGRIPWNKGKKGHQVAWNKGLTKETDDRVKKYINCQIGRPKTKEAIKKQSETMIKKYKNGYVHPRKINKQVKLEELC